MAIAKRIFLFMLTNVLILVTISFVLSLLGVTGYQGMRPEGGFYIDYGSLAIFCLVWGFGGAFISLLLSKTMAKWMMGVRIIDPRSADATEQFLVQTVHRLARAAGINKMPEVGIYNSPEVNAFATGPTKNKALVAVSAGLLHRMNKDEVEGVLGHEVAHIANGDMVTMTLLQGIVNAFVMFFARVIAFAISQALTRGEDDRPNPMIQFALVIVLEIAFSFLGMLVVAYFSRAREFRADIGGARLAGRPKMVNALRALQSNVMAVDNSQPAVAALKISGKQGGLMALLASHPPLEERIKRLQMMTA
jgi:heat shock protein HtpX